MANYEPIYTSVDDVKSEMGYEFNANVPSNIILLRVKEAENKVNMALHAGGYSLPLTTTVASLGECARLYAAGRFMLKDMPVTEGGIKQQGQNKLDEAKECLEKLSMGQIDLIDDNMNIVGASKPNVEFWPDDTTKDETYENAGGEKSFGVKKVW